MTTRTIDLSILLAVFEPFRGAHVQKALITCKELAPKSREGSSPMKRVLIVVMTLSLLLGSSALQGQVRNFTKVWDGGVGGADPDGAGPLPPNLVRAWAVIGNNIDLDKDGIMEFVSYDGTLRRIIVWEATGDDDYAVVWHKDKNNAAEENTLRGNQRSIMITDLDADGNLELVIIWDAFHPDFTDGFNALEVYEHDPSSGEFLPAVPTLTYDPPRDAVSRIALEFMSVATDVDGDGIVELILTYRGGNGILLSIISLPGKNFATPDWMVEYIDSDGNRFDMKVHSMTVGDLDGDGKMDMLVQIDGDDQPIIVYTATAANTYTSVMFDNSMYHADYHGSAAKLIMADMNGDGNTEVYLGARGGNIWVVSGITNISTAFSAAKFSLIADIPSFEGRSTEGVELRGGLLGDADNNGKDSFYVTARGPYEAVYDIEWVGGTGDVTDPSNYQMFNLFHEDTLDDVTVGFVALAIGDLDGDGLDHLDIVFTSGRFGNEGVKPGIYLIENDATDPPPTEDLIGQTFTRITTGDIVNDGGASLLSNWIDYDSDGDLDLFVVNWDETNFLYQNIGGATFIKINTGIIVSDNSGSHSCSWGDYDNDGYPDLYVSNWGQTNFLYKNNGDGAFTRVTTGSIANDWSLSHGSTWGDYDNDGYLDLFVANRGPTNNLLYQNNGDGTFSRITSGSIVNDGGNSFGCSWGDYDNDGYLDLFVANGGWDSGENNFLYKNNGDGTFLKITTGDIVNDGRKSFGSSWGDYDNDGDLDLFVPSGYRDNDLLYQNNGDGTFTRVTTGEIVNQGNSFHSSGIDYDNDGDLDLYIMKDYSNGPLFQNNGDGTFTRITTGNILNDHQGPKGFSWGDFDKDGDTDLFVAHDNGINNSLFANDGNTNNWINIKCIGIFSNTSALGAKVRVKANINGSDVWQLNEISGQTGGGLGSQNSLNAEFGLGDATVIDSLIIEWPSGVVQDTTNVAVDQFLTIVERVVPSIAVLPNTLDFGLVYIGFPVTLAVMIKNTGIAPLQITGISVTGVGFTANTDTFTVEIGASHLIEVELEATAVQAYTSLLTITSNDPDNPAVTVVLQGQGLIKFALHQNYPNPFNPSAPFNPTATIRFDLPEASQASLIVYDVLGREIANLVERDMEPGFHSIIWNAKDKAGRDLPSGLYIARIVTPIYTRSIKMVLLK